MIDEEKVKEEFNRRAIQFGDNNAVLDATSREESVVFSNVFRDYITKKGLINSIPFNKNSTVLDFGCGVGRLSKFISQKVDHVVGVDISGKMIEVANLINSGSNISYFNIPNGPSNLIGNYKFNTIFSYWVIQHISNTRLSEILKEFSALLTADGRIYICEQISTNKLVTENIHIQRTEEDYIQLFNQNGFEIVSKKIIFRMPSYGLNLFKKIGSTHPFILWICGWIETMTANRKPEHMEYYTSCMTFKLSIRKA